MARRYGATEELLSTLGEPDRETLTPAEQAAIRFAEKVTTGHREMGPEDIDYLFGRVNVDTPVRIIKEPVKVG